MSPVKEGFSMLRSSSLVMTTDTCAHQFNTEQEVSCEVINQLVVERPLQRLHIYMNCTFREQISAVRE